MHMLSKKDLNSAELDTVRVCRSPPTVITANVDVQTNGEATVNVYDLDLFVKVKIRKNTPAVLSLGKLSEGHGHSYEWGSGQEPRLTKNGRTSMARRKTFYRSLSQDYQPALPDRQQGHLQHRYRRTQQRTPREVQRLYDVEVQAVQNWETSGAVPSNQRVIVRTPIQ